MTAGIDRSTSVAEGTGPGSAVLGSTGHHLRADAQRNHARVLEAARVVFAEHGIDAIAAQRPQGSAPRVIEPPVSDEPAQPTWDATAELVEANESEGT